MQVATDLISREKAIDLAYDCEDEFGKDVAFRFAHYLKQLPSAQPERETELISREEALHAITSYNGVVDKSVAKRLLIQTPSTQPEIIHCGDCRYKDDGIDEDGIPFLKCLNGRSYGGTRINDFCSWAVRRTDG